MALTLSRPAVALLAAVGVAAPVVCWVLGGFDRDVWAAGAMQAAVGETWVAAAAGTDEQAGQHPAQLEIGNDWQSAGSAARPSARSLALDLGAADRDPSGLATLDLGVLLRGELQAEVPGLSGAVFVRAEGPDGRLIDAIATIGKPYSLLGLSPGKWELVLRGRAILEQRRFIEIDIERGAIDVDLVVQPAPVVPVVFYTSWGDRLETVLSEPGRDPAGFPSIEILAVSGANSDPSEGRGSFRRAFVSKDTFASAPEVSGWIELRTAPPVEIRLMQAGRELARRTIEDSDELLEFEVDPLEESGRPALTASFVDADTGDTIDQAVVELYRAGEPAPVHTRRVLAGGILRLAGISPGEWVLSVLSPGRAHLLQSFQIEAEGDYELGTIELDPAIGFSARLVGPDGRPLGNRQVYWSRTVATPWLEGAYGHEVARTDARGFFALPAVPRGAMLLRAGGGEFAAQLFEVRAGAVDDGRTLQLAVGVAVDFVLRGAEVEGSLFDLKIHNDQGRLLVTRRGAAGRVTRAQLAPGCYVASVTRAGQTLATDGFVVGDVPLDVALEVSHR